MKSPELLGNHKVLTQRAFDKDNKNPIGAFVGFYDELAKIVRTGWSRCNISKGDCYNFENGIAHAFQNAIFPKPFMRADEDRILVKEMAMDFENKYLSFQNRCFRYFKQANPSAAKVIEGKRIVDDELPAGIFKVNGGLADIAGQALYDKLVANGTLQSLMKDGVLLALDEDGIEKLRELKKTLSPDHYLYPIIVEGLDKADRLVRLDQMIRGRQTSTWNLEKINPVWHLEKIDPVSQLRDANQIHDLWKKLFDRRG